MKFGIMFANAGPFAFPDQLANLAQTAESVGMESIWTVEHVVVPVDYKSKYPYSETGKMPGKVKRPSPPVMSIATVRISPAPPASIRRRPDSAMSMPRSRVTSGDTR